MHKLRLVNITESVDLIIASFYSWNPANGDLSWLFIQNISLRIYIVILYFAIIFLLSFSSNFTNKISITHQEHIIMMEWNVCINTRHAPNARLMLVHRLRRWPNINPALVTVWDPLTLLALGSPVDQDSVQDHIRWSYWSGLHIKIVRRWPCTGKLTLCFSLWKLSYPPAENLYLPEE